MQRCAQLGLSRRDTGQGQQAGPGAPARASACHSRPCQRPGVPSAQGRPDHAGMRRLLPTHHMTPANAWPVHTCQDAALWMVSPACVTLSWWPWPPVAAGVQQTTAVRRRKRQARLPGRSHPARRRAYRLSRCTRAARLLRTLFGSAKSRMSPTCRKAARLPPEASKRALLPRQQARHPSARRPGKRRHRCCCPETADACLTALWCAPNRALVSGPQQGVAVC